MSRLIAVLFVFISTSLLISTQPAQAACPAQEITCGRILNAETKKKGFQKIYQYCGKHQVRTSRSWAFGKCKLSEQRKVYAKLCERNFPNCGCESSKNLKHCTPLEYYFEQNAR